MVCTLTRIYLFTIDTMNHDLLIAKHHAYGLETNSLKLMTSYLRNRHQLTKVNRAFSDWIELLTGIPYGFILGPLLFNIYLSTSYYTDENTDVCNFANDTTSHVSDDDLKEVMIDVEHDFTILVEWFLKILALNTE